MTWILQKIRRIYRLVQSRNFSQKAFGEYYEISVPFLDKNNDYIQFYVNFQDTEVMFTDGGETVNALKMDSSFCNERKQQKINTILQQNHVYLAEDEFVLSVAADKFVMGMHEFLQCMIEISNIT